MGLGIEKPELLLIPLGLLAVWFLIEGLLFLWAFRVGGRDAASGRWSRRRRREQFGESDAPVMRICSWCHGKGALHPHLGRTLGLLEPGEEYEPECPHCQGAGYLDATPSGWERRALRRRLLRQEWRDRE